MKNIDKIINENINSFVTSLMMEDVEPLDGYQSASDPRSLFIDALNNEVTLDINSTEGTVEFSYGSYDFTVDYEAETYAHYEDDEGDYMTPPSSNLVGGDDSRIVNATIYFINNETDEEDYIDIDDELLEVMNNNADFELLNSDYAQSYDDYLDSMNQARYDSYER